MTQRLRLKTTRFVDVHERIWAVGLSLNCGGGANVDQYTSLLATDSRWPPLRATVISNIS